MADISFALVIPFYRNINLLREAYLSALSQTHGFSEILIINDGSPEITHLQLVRLFPLSSVVTQPNKGPSCARNVGLCAAKSDYICFLDSDDLLSPFYVETLYKIIISAPSLPSYLTVSYYKKKLSSSEIFEFKQVSSCPRTFMFSLFNYVFNPRLISSSSLCVSKIFVHSYFQGELFPPLYRDGEDIVASLRLLSCSDGLFVNHKLSFYRVHKFSSSFSFFPPSPNIYTYLMTSFRIFSFPLLILFTHLLVKRFAAGLVFYLRYYSSFLRT